MNPWEVSYLWCCTAAFGILAVLLMPLLIENCTRAFVRGWMGERARQVRNHYVRESENQHGEQA